MIYTDLFVKERFKKEELWLRNNLLYECIVGSQAYGLSTSESDIDIVSIVMPLEQHLYPQRYGYILGFDEEVPNFNCKNIKGERQRIVVPGKDTPLEGEWNSLTRFFYLTGIKGSPNLIECLYVKRNLVTFATDIGWKLRDNRDKFLSMKTFNAFKGYAFSQLHRMRNDINRGKTDNPKRQYMLKEYGMDVKQGSQILRLLDQLNQLLDSGTLDLMHNKEEAKAMRNGEWGTWERFQTYVTERVDILENKALTKSKLPTAPRAAELKSLLQECIEEFYGSDTEAQRRGTEFVSAKDVMDKLDVIVNKVTAQTYSIPGDGSAMKFLE